MSCPKAWRQVLLPGLLIAASFLASRPHAVAQAAATLTSIYTFSSPGSTYYPGALTFGSDGNLYGASPGGAHGSGFIFRTTPEGALTDLYDFGAVVDYTGQSTDGVGPLGGLVSDGAGNLYGITTGGGGDGHGTVFKITTAGKLTGLHSFGGTFAHPIADDPDKVGINLTRGADGNFYGVSLAGGIAKQGTVFRVSSSGHLAVLHNFTGSNGDGPPTCALAAGSDGNLYGQTAQEIYQITLSGVLTVIHTFGANDASNPQGALALGHDGNFYGTTTDGGARGCGTIFKLTPAGAVTTVHTFYYGDGYMAEGQLTSDTDGNLYGTTYGGGTHSRGTIFRFSTAGEFTQLFSFADQADGSSPASGVVLDSSGRLYGTTTGGSNGYDATIFKLQVNAIHPPFFLNETALTNGVYYLVFNENLQTNNIFGYYSYLADPRYIYHFDLGYEFVFDAADGQGGVYLYDFTSKTFFYTSPIFPFPYLYDFTLKTVLYYYPDPSNPERYNTGGVRYFYDFATGTTITK